MLFVPCIVTQLCHVNQQNALFKINALIQLFLSSTRFEHLMFIIRKSIFYMQLYVLCFSCIYASSLAGLRMFDEHKMFETCRRQEEFN